MITPESIKLLWENPITRVVVKYVLPAVLLVCIVGGYLLFVKLKQAGNTPDEVKERVKKADNLPSNDDYNSRRKRMQEFIRECEKGSKCPVRRDR